MIEKWTDTISLSPLLKCPPVLYAYPIHASGEGETQTPVENELKKSDHYRQKDLFTAKARRAPREIKFAKEF
jgi:hypothetical protein